MLSQRQLYARSRMSRAVDRQILAKDSSEKERASRWVLAWAALGGLLPHEASPARSLYSAKRLHLP